MYKITVIENERELLEALRENRHAGDKSPSIQSAELVIDENGFYLYCEDPKFNIKKIDPLKLLQEICSDRSIKLTVNTTVKPNET